MTSLLDRTADPRCGDSRDISSRDISSREMWSAPGPGLEATVGVVSSGPKPDVLIVDDEPQVREVVATYLEREGFSVRSAADGQQALDEIAAKRPDAMVLDLMLPEVSGLEVLQRLRADGDEVPVIVLSARGTEPDRVAGLELGADDYVSKPASPREIAARVRAVLRRARPSGPPTIDFGDVHVDVASRQVSKDGETVELRPKEFDLLVRLASTPGEVMSRQDLLHDVWGSSSEWQDPGTVTVHVRRLRRAIENDAAKPDHIVTVYGIGYRFDA